MLCRVVLSVNSFVLILTNEPAAMLRLRTSYSVCAGLIVIMTALFSFGAITETLDSRKCISLNVINLKNKVQVSTRYCCFPWASGWWGAGEGRERKTQICMKRCPALYSSGAAAPAVLQIELFRLV